MQTHTETNEVKPKITKASVVLDRIMDARGVTAASVVLDGDVARSCPPDAIQIMHSIEALARTIVDDPTVVPREVHVTVGGLTYVGDGYDNGFVIAALPSGHEGRKSLRRAMRRAVKRGSM